MMHRCLYVLDILGVLFDLVLDGPNPALGAKTVIALACACCTFQDTALNTLWRAIPSAYPLIQCLPPDAWTLTDMLYTNMTLVR